MGQLDSASELPASVWTPVAVGGAVCVYGVCVCVCVWSVHVCVCVWSVHMCGADVWWVGGESGLCGWVSESVLQYLRSPSFEVIVTRHSKHFVILRAHSV